MFTCEYSAREIDQLLALAKIIRENSKNVEFMLRVTPAFVRAWDRNCEKRLSAHITYYQNRNQEIENRNWIFMNEIEAHIGHFYEIFKDVIIPLLKANGYDEKKDGDNFWVFLQVLREKIFFRSFMASLRRK